MTKTKDEIYNFLNARMLAVVSTIKEDGTPESAVVGFGQTKDFCLIFGTDNTSRKYVNIKRAPNVSFVIGWDNGETIQYEGLARELDDNEIDLVKDNYWHKNPKATRHDLTPSERYFIVEPKWIRHTDLKAQPWDITEINFNI
jgi:pyridoxine/pyridoxamine 5'-phosphate oxidase